MMKISKKKGKQQGDKRMSYVVTEAGIVEVEPKAKKIVVLMG